MDAARADLYTLLSVSLLHPPTEALLAACAGLRGDGALLGRACDALAAAARQTDAETAGRTHFDLFVGVGRGELLPYASYYLTGFLNERPLAAVRADMDRLGLARAEGLHEPEDHIAILCGVMAGFARGAHIAQGCASEAQFFSRHLAPWAGRFFADLARARPTGFHAALGAVGAAFMDVEEQAFALEAGHA
jgi:TorA maturation chaperone TorD